MKNRLNEIAYRAFEERHSASLNPGFQPGEKIPWLYRPGASQLERAADFSCVEPILEKEPTDAVEILLITQLARHLIKSRTSPFRVRRDRAQSAKALDSYFVPRIDYELHWSALSVWHRRYPELPAVLRQGQALHPATLALIDTRASAARWEDKPLTYSREEYDFLSDEQLVCNAIAERMRAWAAQPANKMRTKAWETRLDIDQEDFLARFTPTAESSPHQLLRFDLFYAGQSGPDRGFGTIPADVVKNDVDRLREALERSPSFRGQIVEFYPYADFSVRWVIPGVILLPASAASPWTLLEEVKACWKKIAEPRGGWLQASYTAMKGEFRYVTDEQRMLDPIWLQLSRAAAYLFDTRLILDSSMDAMILANSLDRQHPTNKQTARSNLCSS